MNPSSSSATTPLHPNWFIVIMAGGRGERFWPVSREATPKQLITLLGGRSFLQQAVDRVIGLVPAENIFVITNAIQAPAARQQLPEISADNIIGEPVGRDTCAAVALGAALVGARNPAGVMAVLSADHLIPEVEKFQQVLADALDLASRREVIVTIGIQPTSPETGYGYIQAGAALSSPLEERPVVTSFFRAERFVEKPNLETAQRYLASQHFRWNAGMFVWSFQTIAAALAEHQPEIAAGADRWMQAAVQGQTALLELLAAEYPSIKKISIDFALMEHAKNVVVADGAFAWDDLGAWPALARHLPQDAEGNASVGAVVQVAASGNLVFDARTKSKSLINLVGMKDAIVVLTDDAVLVAAKSEAQRIKELVKLLGATPAYCHLV